MTDKFHMCNATNGDWAYINLFYYTTNCTLVRYEYADPYKVPIFVFYIYYILYLLLNFIIIPILLLLAYKYFKNKFISQDGQGLISVHPPGYWAAQVADNAPFGQFFRRNN